MKIPTKKLNSDPCRLFGIHLAALRKERFISQEQLSFASGLARSYLSGVERGKRNIALVNICKLALALGLRPSELMLFDSNHL